MFPPGIILIHDRYEKAPKAPCIADISRLPNVHHLFRYITHSFCVMAKTSLRPENRREVSLDFVGNPFVKANELLSSLHLSQINQERSVSGNNSTVR